MSQTSDNQEVSAKSNIPCDFTCEEINLTPEEMKEVMRSAKIFIPSQGNYEGYSRISVKETNIRGD